MKVYSFGKAENPAILLLPGTCCDWKGNFGGVIPLLEPDFHVLCVSYDGFDETEPGNTFPTMEEETTKIEAYIKENCGGHIRAAYGCSLGGSFVGLLAARQKIKLDIGILGSSDLDQASPFKAGLLTNIMMPPIYPLIRDGKFGMNFLNKRIEKTKAGNAGICRCVYEDDGRCKAIYFQEKLQKSVLFGYDHAAARPKSIFFTR